MSGSSYFDGMSETLIAIHGETTLAVFTPQSDPTHPVSLPVIFMDRNFDEKVDQTTGYCGPKPVAWYQLDLIDPKYDDLITINGKDYKIKNVDPDGLKMVRLTLAAQS